MEKQFFTWDGWDEQDTGSMSFYDCVLKVPIGEYKPGDKIDVIYVNYEKGQMSFYNHAGEELLVRKLKLVTEE